MAERIFTEEQLALIVDLKDQLDQANRVLPGRLRAQIAEIQARNPGSKIDLPDSRRRWERESLEIVGAGRILDVLLGQGDVNSRWGLVTGLEIALNVPTEVQTELESSEDKPSATGDQPERVIITDPRGSGEPFEV